MGKEMRLEDLVGWTVDQVSVKDNYGGWDMTLSKGTDRMAVEIGGGRQGLWVFRQGSVMDGGVAFDSARDLLDAVAAHAISGKHVGGGAPIIDISEAAGLRVGYECIACQRKWMIYLDKVEGEAMPWMKNREQGLRFIMGGLNPMWVPEEAPGSDKP